MRTSLAALALLLLAAPLRAENSWIDAAAQPSYRAAEKVADGLYDAVRVDVIDAVLPRRPGDESGAAPEESSYAAFSAELSARQVRAARRDWEARPAPGSLSSAEIGGWLAASAAAHRDAVLDAFAASLMERYRLKRLGSDSGELLRDPGNWSAGLLAPAVLFSGAYAYFTGVRADFDAGSLKVGLDLVPGRRLRTLSRSSDSGHIARLALSKSGIPLSLYAEWGPARAADRVGASWSSRF